ncbi:uncharacterized protein LOC123003680 [Tribolium madens]|uniref:uncharacterized protein LOC123003680 n=1 Tax=Tribolium madens TaxID=41895 RepID=UPI001CF749A8|nr:uncharacterized protein LOC123003680 [Tribolium madens]
MFEMGQRHSKRAKILPSQPEVTEIFELNDNQSELDNSEVDTVVEIFPVELKNMMDALESIERTIEAMTMSQIDLYYATLKDDLHNHWQKAYDFMDHGDEATKKKKIEVIDRVKKTLKRLNEKVLIKKQAVYN